MKASSIKDIYKAIRPDEAISPRDPRYVELSAARGDDALVDRIVRRICAMEPGHYHRHLVTGLRGSGKSTELLKLRTKLEDLAFLVAFLDVEGSLNLADVEYIDVLLGIVYELEKEARKRDLKTDEKLIGNIEKWLAEILITEEKKEEEETTVGASGGVGFEIPLIAKLLTNFTTQIKDGNVKRIEIRQKLEQKLEDFTNLINQFITDITLKALDAGFTGVIVIVDSLEKILYKVDQQGETNHTQIFIEHAEQLKKPCCHLIYTVPISLLYDKSLGSTYSDIDPFPMVTIFDKDGADYEPGLNALCNTILQRITNVELIFASDQLVFDLVKISGGVIRDLMRLVLFAADFTPDDGKINEAAIHKASQVLVREYDRLIAQEDIETLLEVSKNPHIPNSLGLSKLMQRRLVLSYIDPKGNNWYGVHRAALSSPTYQSAVSSKKL